MAVQSVCEAGKEVRIQYQGASVCVYVSVCEAAVDIVRLNESLSVSKLMVRHGPGTEPSVCTSVIMRAPAIYLCTHLPAATDTLCVFIHRVCVFFSVDTRLNVVFAVPDVLEEFVSILCVHK